MVKGQSYHHQVTRAEEKWQKRKIRWDIVEWQTYIHTNTPIKEVCSLLTEAHRSSFHSLNPSLKTKWRTQLHHPMQVKYNKPNDAYSISTHTRTYSVHTYIQCTYVHTVYIRTHSTYYPMKDVLYGIACALYCT